VTSAELLERGMPLGEGALGACPSCGSPRPEVFHEQTSIPVHSCRLVETHEEALSFPRGSLRLAFCPDCGFITNTTYDAALQDYGVAYEETQGFSPHFRDFARALAERWIERNDLRGKTVLEIGCGKGEFLSLLCELGGNRGIGIDPAFVEERLEPKAAHRLSFIRDLYDERYAHLEADAIVCRHTLEHIAPVADFLALVRRTISDRSGTAVLFDLPDVLRVLREPAFWDVYYEHCSYFSAGSLARLFRRSGFRVVELERDYDDQYLVIDALPGADDGARPLPLEETPEELREDVAGFTRKLAEITGRWRAQLGAARADGRRAAIWGAGSKGVSFLTTLDLREEIAYAVDINPYKQRKFLAGTGHAVVGPAHLVEEPPDLVVAMNSIYLREIRAQLDGLGLQATELMGV
jgi:SAM-dependent methyltransferase